MIFRIVYGGQYQGIWSVTARRKHLKSIETYLLNPIQFKFKLRHFLYHNFHITKTVTSHRIPLHLIHCISRAQLRGNQGSGPFNILYWPPIVNIAYCRSSEKFFFQSFHWQAIYPWAAYNVKAHPALFEGRSEPKMRHCYSSLQLTYTVKTHTKHYSSLQLTYIFKTRTKHTKTAKVRILCVYFKISVSTQSCHI